MLTSILCAATSLASAQVTIKFTPDTASQAAVIGRAHGLQYYVLTMYNSGTAAHAPLSLEQIIIASPVNLVPLSDAKNIIGAKIARSFWGNVLHYGTYTVEAAGLGVALWKLADPSVSANAVLGLSIASSLGIGAQQIAQQNLPSAAALYNQINYPLTLGPSGSPTAMATDHEFAIWAGKKVKVKAETVTIP